jgi:hypothetical protein
MLFIIDIDIENIDKTAAKQHVINDVHIMTDNNDIDEALKALSDLTSYDTVTEAKRVHVFNRLTRLKDDRIE